MNSEPNNHRPPTAIENPQNPYSVQPVAVATASSPTVRPTWVTVVGILCLLGGIVGVISGLLGIIGYLFSQQFANVFTPPGGAQDIQRQMQMEMNAVNAKYFWVSLPITIAAVALYGCWTAGGIGLLRSKEWARVLTSRALGAAIVLEFVRVTVNGMTQLEMAPVMQSYMEKMSAGSGQAMPGMGQMMQVFMIIGIAMMLLWSICKIAMMWWARKYLRRETTKEYFVSAAD